MQQRVDYLFIKVFFVFDAKGHSHKMLKRLYFKIIYKLFIIFLIRCYWKARNFNVSVEKLTIKFDEKIDVPTSPHHFSEILFAVHTKLMIHAS